MQMDMALADPASRGMAAVPHHGAYRPYTRAAVQATAWRACSHRRHGVRISPRDAAYPLRLRHRYALADIEPKRRAWPICGTAEQTTTCGISQRPAAPTMAGRVNGGPGGIFGRLRLNPRPTGLEPRRRWPPPLCLA